MRAICGNLNVGVDRSQRCPILIYSQRLAMQIPNHNCLLVAVSLVLLLRPHIHNLQRRVLQLNNMSRLQRLGVNIVHIMRMEDTRLRAIENRLFTWWVREAEAAPAIAVISTNSTMLRDEGQMTYLGCLVGAQTIAILSGIIT
jgi:hypothetical protein